MDLDYYGKDWFELEWSGWMDLKPENEKLKTISGDSGIYRIRHKKREKLEYINETNKLDREIRKLSQYIQLEKMPFQDPHSAAPSLWAIKDSYGSGFEISYVTSEKLEEEKNRKSVESALIALYRKKMDESPTANFERIIPGYKRSTYREEGERGKKLNTNKRNSIESLDSLSWENRSETTSDNWAGLDWSDAYKLAKRETVSIPDTGIYRIWSDESDPSLLYIGQSKDLSRRLYNHRNMLGDDKLFSYTTFEKLNDMSKRLELEKELIGIYHIVHNEPPLEQF